MIISHISDTHSALIKINPKADLIIHSGDFLPNCSRGNIVKEMTFQEKWLRDNKSQLIDWIGDKPFLFCPGNHDFIDPVPTMREFGINAIDLCNKVVTLNNMSFYGFPYVSILSNEWNYELDVERMAQKVRQLTDAVNDHYVDILVAHSPLHGILDVNHYGDHIGDRILVNAFNYEKFTHVPTAYLHGHCHEYGGFVSKLYDMLISNAATTQIMLQL